MRPTVPGAVLRRTIPLLGDTAYLALVKDTENGIAGGACDVDPGRAMVRAEGEFAEHVSQVSAPGQVRLTGAGQPLDPRRFCPDAAAADAVRCWVHGRGMVSGNDYALPAQAVFLGWDPPAGEPKLWFQTSVGTAAHGDPATAEASALAEVIERDTLVRGWQTGNVSFHDLTHLAAEAMPAEFVDRINAYGVTLTVVRVGGATPDIVLAMLSRADGANLTCGAALRASTIDAVRHATLEALAVRVALSSPRPPHRLEAHHRARGVLAARNGQAHLRFVAGHAAEPAGPRASPGDFTQLLVMAEKRFGHEPIVVELPDVADHVVRRVVCPGSVVFESVNPTDAFLCPIA
jgi:ribosomal protein S12 methylthiotransferase accessory factor YcaO